MGVSLGFPAASVVAAAAASDMLFLRACALAFTAWVLDTTAGARLGSISVPFRESLGKLPFSQVLEAISGDPHPKLDAWPRRIQLELLARPVHV